MTEQEYEKIRQMVEAYESLKRRPMTKLEKEIAEAIETSHYAEHDITMQAKLIADVAKKWMKKAFAAREVHDNGYKFIEEWMKENGIIE